MLDPIGNLPFAIELQRSRERIEVHIEAKANEKEHYRAHRAAESLEQARLDLEKSYDRMGRRIEFQKEQGLRVNIKV
jgi:hypothetical protein